MRIEPLSIDHARRVAGFLRDFLHFTVILDRLIEEPPSPRVEPEGLYMRGVLESSRRRLHASVTHHDRSTLVSTLTALCGDEMPRCDFVASEGEGDTHEFVLLRERLQAEALALTKLLVEPRQALWHRPAPTRVAA